MKGNLNEVFTVGHLIKLLRASVLPLVSRKTKHNILAFLTYLKERAKIERKTETKEFVSGICGCGSELPEVKSAGNAGHTITLV